MPHLSVSSVKSNHEAICGSRLLVYSFSKEYIFSDFFSSRTITCVTSGVRFATKILYLCCQHPDLRHCCRNNCWPKVQHILQCKVKSSVIYSVHIKLLGLMYFLCFRVLCHKLSSDTSESADRAAESGCRACQQLWAQFQPGRTWLSHKIEEWQLLWKSRGFGAHVRTDATCGLPPGRHGRADAEQYYKEENWQLPQLCNILFECSSSTHLSGGAIQRIQLEGQLFPK